MRREKRRRGRGEVEKKEVSEVEKKVKTSIYKSEPQLTILDLAKLQMGQ